MSSAVAVLGACLLLAARAFAFEIGVGTCPEKGKVVSGFQVARYMGHWYEIERFPQFWEFGGKCSSADYTLRSDGKVAVKNAMQSSQGNEVTQEGFAEVTSTNGDAELLVTFDVPIIGKQQANYWVLDTDYDNYALVYSCVNFTVLKLEGAWILGRDATLGGDSRAKVEAAIKANALNRKAFRPTAQDCRRAT